MFFTPEADKPFYVKRFDKITEEWVIYSVVRRYLEHDPSIHQDIENFVAGFSDEDVAENMIKRLNEMEESGGF